MMAQEELVKWPTVSQWLRWHETGESSNVTPEMTALWQSRRQQAAETLALFADEPE
jgi:hypothetical protein